MTSTDKSLPPFEKAVEMLEQIIEQIESGETGLQQCLVHYEQGTKLVAHCRTILSTVEQRIAQLTVDSEGKLSISPSTASSDDEPFEHAE